KHVLEHTEQIRVGSGGIMLPNHAPLVVAEQFGTMATIYPDRLDLGLGRAPGTDMMTADALRRSSHEAVFQFPTEIGSAEWRAQVCDSDLEACSGTYGADSRRLWRNYAAKPRSISSSRAVRNNGNHLSGPPGFRSWPCTGNGYDDR